MPFFGVKYGGDFSKYKERDMEEAAADIEAQGIEKLTKDRILLPITGRLTGGSRRYVGS